MPCLRQGEAEACTIFVLCQETQAIEETVCMPDPELVTLAIHDTGGTGGQACQHALRVFPPFPGHFQEFVGHGWFDFLFVGVSEAVILGTVAVRTPGVKLE